MPRTRNPYPAEFREQIVALGRTGRSVEDLAREFEPCAATIHGWIKQADRDGGRRTDGLSSEERDELRRLRRENRQLRQERDILAKAAAWFAQSDVTSSRFTNS
jgi:transposase